MSQTDAKVSSVSDSSYTDESLYPQMSRLSEMLKEISYNLSESNSAARAHAIVETCITLNTVNYQTMTHVCHELIQVDACNIFPTSKETQVPRETFLEAQNLAEDILHNLPIDVVLIPQPEEQTADQYSFIGKVTNIRRVMTKNMDVMAVIHLQPVDSENVITMVAFPRTWEKYGGLIETRHDYDFAIIFESSQYIQDSNEYILSHADIPTNDDLPDTRPLPELIDGEPQIYRAVYVDEEPNLFDDDLRWQAQYFSGTTYHRDGYERCGFYATEQEAIEGAKRAKSLNDSMKALSSGEGNHAN
ncbi:MAG: hypothetical protein AAF846_22290 [Chloroflexota bacterium]